jgi:hypothetical protein
VRAAYTAAVLHANGGQKTAQKRGLSRLPLQPAEDRRFLLDLPLLQDDVE